MWLFVKNGFVSAVEFRGRPNDLIVRARRRGDLSKLFPKREKQIEKTPNADYLYRLVVSKKEFAKVVSDYILRNLTYDNFKGAQEKDSREWFNFLHSVWAEGFELQRS